MSITGSCPFIAGCGDVGSVSDKGLFGDGLVSEKNRPGHATIKWELGLVYEVYDKNLTYLGNLYNLTHELIWYNI